VGRGNAYYSPKIATRLKARQRLAFQHGRTVTAPPKLTRREEEVVRLIARGEPNKAIAYSLGLSIKTVEKHRQAAMDKLNIHDIAGLTRYALSKGIVAPSRTSAVASPNSLQTPAPAS
jgi:DNA-binding NarL/FixJ family response regulator